MFAAGLASFLVGSGNRGPGDEEEHRSREHPRVKCGSEVFGLGLSEAHTCLDDSSRACKVFLVRHRFQLCVSPACNHAGHSLCSLTNPLLLDLFQKQYSNP